MGSSIIFEENILFLRTLGTNSYNMSNLTNILFKKMALLDFPVVLRINLKKIYRCIKHNLPVFRQSFLGNSY